MNESTVKRGTMTRIIRISEHVCMYKTFVEGRARMENDHSHCTHMNVRKLVTHAQVKVEMRRTTSFRQNTAIMIVIVRTGMKTSLL